MLRLDEFNLIISRILDSEIIRNVKYGVSNFSFLITVWSNTHYFVFRKVESYRFLTDAFEKLFSFVWLKLRKTLKYSVGDILDTSNRELIRERKNIQLFVLEVRIVNTKIDLNFLLKTGDILHDDSQTTIYSHTIQIKQSNLEKKSIDTYLTDTM